MSKRSFGLAAAALLATASFAQAQDCETKVGLVMELTGPAGEYGQAGAKSVEMAFRDINDAGGVNGCKLVTDTRNSQSQGNVAVDAATQLVQVGKVPVVIGGIISSVSIPILTSVTGAGRRRAGFAGLLVADADRARPRREDQRRLLPHHHLRRAAGNGGGEIRARPGAEEALDHPRQQRFRRQHGRRVQQGLQGARRRDRLGHALQREPGELSGRSDGGDGGRARRRSISSAIRSTARRSPGNGSRRAGRKSSC